MSSVHLCLPRLQTIHVFYKKLKLKHFHSTAAKETIQFAQLKTTICNTYQMITRYRKVSVGTEDTFKQLEMANNAKILLATLNESLFIVDMIFKNNMSYSNVLKSHHTAMCGQM